jgi:hypothetical protein
MKRRRRLNWVRVTRDPPVAADHERDARASAEWHLALLEAFRHHFDPSAPSSSPFPGASASPPGQPRQYALPFADEPARA